MPGGLILYLNQRRCHPLFIFLDKIICIILSKIEFITDTVLYEGSSVEELKKNFREAVQDYIEACEEMGKKPQKPFKGKILARIGPELHKKAALIALQKRVSLNKFVESAIRHEIELNL